MTDRPGQGRGPGSSALEAGDEGGADHTAAEADQLQLQREGLQAQATSQWKLFRRRFFRHKPAVVSLVVLAVIVVAALNAEVVAPYEFDELDLVAADRAPTLEGSHFFGTDRLGRDYFSRVLFGTATSVTVAIIVATAATGIGIVVGALAGYFGRWVDNLLMRFTDLVVVIPGLAILLLLVTFLGKGSPYRVALILAALLWTTVARIVRASFLALREKEFVEAASVSGVSDFRMIFRHILPNAFGPIIVNATLMVSSAILIEASLSFLGVGVQPPNPTLGNLIAEGRGTMLTQWWLVTMPGLVIVVICLCVNFVGDGLRDGLDPSQRRR